MSRPGVTLKLEEPLFKWQGAYTGDSQSVHSCRVRYLKYQTDSVKYYLRKAVCGNFDFCLSADRFIARK